MTADNFFIHAKKTFRDEISSINHYFVHKYTMYDASLAHFSDRLSRVNTLKLQQQCDTKVNSPSIY